MSKMLRELPHFDFACYVVRNYYPKSVPFIEIASRAIVPGLDECQATVLQAIASSLWVQAQVVARNRLRLVPQPKPQAANDREAQ